MPPRRRLDRVSLLDAAGTSLGSTTHTDPPNDFEQVSISPFVNNAPARGSLILYGATNDNRTNDPAIAFFTRG